jgi:hypothetical protein
MIEIRSLRHSLAQASLNCKHNCQRRKTSLDLALRGFVDWPSNRLVCFAAFDCLSCQSIIERHSWGIAGIEQRNLPMGAMSEARLGNGCEQCSLAFAIILNAKAAREYYQAMRIIES